MVILKNKNVEVNINEKGADNGNIGVNFYTEDKGTTSIRIKIKHLNQPFNLKKHNYIPRLDLLHSDGSIFTNQEVEIVQGENGLIQYKPSDQIMKHYGKVNVKLILKNETESVHAANFEFNILSSGIEEAVNKEVSVTLVEDTVRKIAQENALEIIDDSFKEKLNNDVIVYLNENTDLFKGPQGNKGDPGKDGTDSPLKGLEGVFIGDSITEKNFRTTKNYHEYIAERTGMSVVNMGKSGTGYQDRKNVAYDLIKQPDFICIFLGTNDWGLVGSKTKELGTVEEHHYSTVAGSIFYTFEQLINMYPTTPIVAMTPLPRIESNPKNNNVNDKNYTLEQLSEVIKGVAKLFSIPVLDLYHNSNLRVWNSNINKMFFAWKDGAEDGLHPNDKGHEFISYIIQSFLENNAVVGQKNNFSLSLKEETQLEENLYTKEVLPTGMFWKQDTSFVINIKQSDLDLTLNTISKIEYRGASIVNPRGITSNSPYWYTIPTYPEGDKNNRISEVVAFTDALTKIDFTEKRGYEYMPDILKVTYSRK